MIARRTFSSRQVTVMVVAVSVAVVATPAAVLAATGTFRSSTAGSPAVSATNSSSGAGAKGVFGNAVAGHGRTYGVFGKATSPAGFGLFAAGRLGSSGALVCSACVTAHDVDPSGFPTVPSADNAAHLGGHGVSHFGQIRELSWSHTFTGDGDVALSDTHVTLDGLVVTGYCSTSFGSFVAYVDATTPTGGTISWNYSSAPAQPNDGVGSATLTTQNTYFGSAATSATTTVGVLVWAPTGGGPTASVTWQEYVDADGCNIHATVSAAA